MPKKSIDGQRAEAGELQSRENSLHQIPCFLQQGRSIRQIPIVIHVNAVISLSDFQKKESCHSWGCAEPQIMDLFQHIRTSVSE